MKDATCTRMTIVTVTLLACLAFVTTVRAADSVVGTVGLTEPFRDADLCPFVAGVIDTIYYKEGDSVSNGAVVVQLDNSVEELEVKRRKLILESQAELQAAQARCATLRIDLEGTRHLFKTTKSVSEEELAERELAVKLADAECEQLETAEKREQMEYDMALQRLRQRNVSAPFKGVISEIYTELGEGCEPRLPVVRLVDVAQCYVVANVTAIQSRRFTIGQKVGIAFEAPFTDATVEGQVSSVSPVVDAASGLRRVKILFDNAKTRIPPGVSARIISAGAPHEQ